MLHVMNGAGAPGPASDPPKARGRKATGTWAGFVIFALVLLYMIIFDARIASQHRWVNFTGITVFILVFVIVATGGAKRLRRVLKDRQSSKPLGG